MKISNEIRLAALTMTASFAVTFAYLWWQRGPALTDITPTPREVGRTRATAPVRAPTKQPAVLPAAPAAVAPKVLARDPPKDTVPAENLDGPPLPLLVAVTAVPGNIAENSTADSQDAESSNQVDLLNTSDQLLAVTVIDANPAKRKTSSTQVLLQPGAQAHIGAEASLPMESRDVITLRSTGFRDTTQTVP